ncbi:MAG: hypothetical protein ACJAU0_001542 [Flavobacteriales bacterium]|jgi:hypothetical protein
MSEFNIVQSTSCKAEFDQLALLHGGIFFDPEVIACSGESVEQLAIIDHSGKCVGGFNIQKIPLKGIQSLAAPKFHPHCGLFILPFQGALSTVQGKKKKVLTAIAAYLLKREEKIISIPFPPSIQDMQPFIWKGFKSSVKYTYHLDLKGDQKALDKFSSKTRNSINKGVKSGVKLNLSPMIDSVLTCLNNNAKQQGFSYEQQVLSQLVSLSLKGKGKTAIAIFDGIDVATAVTIADAKQAYYLFGGINRSTSVQGALGFVLMELMNHHQKRGVEVFDFEGSMIPAVENFFRSFGGQQIPYYVIAKAPFWLAPFLQLRGKKEF